MGFFDLNIPYHESDRHVVDKSSLKGRRLKLALKAMELGYSGAAYNRTLKGVMSESDRCSTLFFPLSKLTPSSSSFFAAVKLHRELLNVAVSSPFRQYTRLTVIVDISSQASALNAGNPILKSYDIVAVRPMNQNAFDQACQTAERGIYFEITYSGLIADMPSRRQMISNCKLLVDWTRGKNLIICSAAPSVTELRGPQDVANLFSLLGLPTERAKAAISKNCRSLLANALRKKHFYKEAVKVEEIPSGGQFNPAQSAFDDWLKWDPISSGEGDMLLDDMEKSFAISNTLTESVKKTINFTSNMNGLPAHGLHIKDLISVTKAALEPPETNNFEPVAMETEKAAIIEKPEEQGDLNPKGLVALQARSEEGQISSNDAKTGHEASGFEDSEMSYLSTHNGTYTYSEETVPISSENLDHSNDLEANYKNALHDTPSEVYGGNALHDDGGVITKIETPITDNHVSKELLNPLNESGPSAFALEESNVENRCGVGVCAQEGVPNEIDSENKQELHVASNDAPSEDVYVEGKQCCETTDSSLKLGDCLPVDGLLNPTTDVNEPISYDVMGDMKQIDPVTNYRGLGKSQAGKERRKRNAPHKPFLFPFKRFLNPRPSKRKSWK
ncbi:hypothetical protein DH2020_013885 [Rehmannia glutinosa]|uniref:Uncharacterized protein n=1 Tax=Rehmannia glutinosa TaxID=99300 RepID=A0ABR0W329_REHGL